MTVERQNLSEYLNGTRLIVLATTNGDEAPGLRVLGGFGVEGNTVFFSTAPGSEKATQLKQNENVSVLFQHENQEQASFANVTLKGKAKILEEKEEVEQAIEFIGRRNPRFKPEIIQL
ncbi:MAG: pyridoxamine 5'-phosphate oxidase family protein [Chloroflexota bacterium]